VGYVCTAYILSWQTLKMTKGLTLILTLLTMIAFGQEVRLVDFQPSECDETSDPYHLKTRIIDQEFHGDTLQIKVATKATCCVDFIPSITYNQDTLNLLFEETGIECECICCYQFNYHITGLKDKNFGVKLLSKAVEQSDEKYKTYPVEYFVFNGDTTGYKDKYGLRQGIHVSEFRGKLLYRHIKDDQYIKFVLTDKNGNILKESTDYIEIWEYEKE